MNQLVLPRSCASCGETACAMSIRQDETARAGSMTTYIVDEVWPEFESYIGALRKTGDQFLSPGLFGKARLARYGWGPLSSHRATAQTLCRHIAMRRVAGKSGALRQKTYLHHDQLIARALAQHVDYRARHLVIAQTWLPWLAAAGVLGGRSYDVLMSRYPLAEVHGRLDEVARHTGPSKTIADFRADPAVVALETTALANARKIITPHHGIADLFPENVVRLAWLRPTIKSVRKGQRFAFLGPTIARQRADIVREIATGLPEPLIVMGANLEGADFWSGVPIERRNMDGNWLDDVGTILHPATMTNQPRALLQALANGVTIIATEGCGLAPADFLGFEQSDQLRNRSRASDSQLEPFPDSSSFPRTWESRLSTSAIAESLDSRIRGNDGGGGFN